jgi:hypothetical protein
VSGFLLALGLYIPPGSRSASTATRTGYPSWSVDALRIELYGFEAEFHARCCIRTSENSSSRHFGE